MAPLRCLRIGHAAAIVALALLVLAPRLAGATVETRDLIVFDAAGSVAPERLQALAGRAQTLLERVLAFWDADAGTARYGKISVLFDAPSGGNYSSVFYWEGAGSARRRVVRVFGFDRPSQEFAHKLTSAVFPHQDKLIRNMMGVLAETELGNPLTFPACGFAPDDWVTVFATAKALVPLAELGPDHESWGMRFAAGGRVSVFDRQRQHAAYAAAGSFGIYLDRRFGRAAVKRLWARSEPGRRRFEDAFGAPLGELERDWLAALARSAPARQGAIATVGAAVAAHPSGGACRAAAQSR